VQERRSWITVNYRGAYGLYAFEPLQHWQQRLPATGKHSVNLRSVVVMHDLQRRLLLRRLRLCLTDLHGGFLGSSFEVGKPDSAEFAGNRLKFQLRRGHHLARRQSFSDSAPPP
jgi:hypothetical protein